MNHQPDMLKTIANVLKAKTRSRKAGDKGFEDGRLDMVI